MGNSWVSYTEGINGNAQVVEENSYYAFGLQHKGYGPALTGLGNAHAEKYRFLGQERQEELGLGWDSFRHRNYDYAIGRFFGVDPIAEEYMTISPYQFAHNSPIWKIELEGLEGQPKTNIDVLNQESVYMSRNVILNTIKYQNSKPQHSRPGVPVIRMGVELEASRDKSLKSALGEANGTATAAKATLALAVCVDGERIEYGLTVAQLSGNVSVDNEELASAEATVLNIEGSYNLRNGNQESNINALTGEVSAGSDDETQSDTADDWNVALRAMGVFIEANMTEAGNNLQDLGNLVMSYLQGFTESYFNENNNDNSKVKPVR